MNYTDNRLQFIHSDRLFENSQAAKDYVNEISKIERPALYSEPMILKYGDAENPNIILAIGSVGVGEASLNNRIFFIDVKSLEDSIAQLEQDETASKEDIVSIKQLIKRIMTACGVDEVGNYQADLNDALLKNATSFKSADTILSEALQNEIKRAQETEEKLDKEHTLNVEDTDSVQLNLVKDENGMVLKGNVKLAENFISDMTVLPNSMISTPNGLFLNIDLNYNDKDATLSFETNGEKKELQLPHETHLIGGEYDNKTESLILTLNRKLDESVQDSDKIVVNLAKLIGEWTVLGNESETPVVLTKEPCSYTDELHGAEQYQDILKADVRIIDEVQPEIDDNILKRSGNGKSLYVKGTADNILYWKNGQRITVKQALDEVKCQVSNFDNNIITEKSDGIFADVQLEYVTATNTLRFTKSVTNGDVQTKEMKLNNISFLENIYYDSLKEEIVIQYKDATSEIQEIRIPVSSLLDEWDVENTNHTITLTKERHAGSGVDKLSGDVNIATASDNILQVVSHGLYVKGTADNISYNNSTVKDSLDLLNAADDTDGSVRNLIKKETDARTQADENLYQLINAEKERATNSETQLDAKISANTTAISEEAARAKAAEETNKNSIDAEVLRATGEEKRIEGEFTTFTNKQSNVNTQFADAIKTLQSDLTNEISRSTTKDSELETKLTSEIARATGEENRINTAFNAYKESAEQQHSDLNKKVDNLTDNLQSETESRLENEKLVGDAISNEIQRATTAEAQLTSDLAALKETVTNNATNIGSVSTTVDKLTEKVDKEIIRATESENALKLSVSEEKSVRENKDIELNGLITANKDSIAAEISRATGVENDIKEDVAANTQAIADEKTRAEQAEKANSDAIAALDKKTTMSANNTGTINLTKSVLENGEGYTLSGTVNVSDTVNNIINRDGSALFASVDLVYDGGSNTLTLKTSNNADKTIKLNAGSVITNIEYKSDEKKLIIHYTDAQSQPQQVEVNVADLFNEITVENPAENAITLKLTDAADGSKVLTADANVSSEQTNLLQKVTGNLYVSNAASGIKFEDGKSVVDKVYEINNTISANKSDADSKYTALDGKVTTINATVTSNTDRIVALETKDTEFASTIQGIKDNATQEINDRTSADNEIKVSVSTLDTKVDTEVGKLKDSDTALSNRVSLLETNLPKEVENRTAADDVLRASILENTNNITSEINNREKGDTELSNKIDTLQSNLDGEVSRAIAKENEISDSLNKSIERLTVVEGTATANTNSINSANEKIQANTQSIAQETADRKAEDAKITQSVTDLTNVVSDNKKELTCNVKNTGSIELTKEANATGDGYVLSGKVKVSNAANNILNQTDDSLYASVDLQYNSATNVLSLITSNNATKEITLSIGSIIKNITYDSENKQLVIIYIDENKEERIVNVPVSDLYNEWVVEDRDASVIKLTKVKGESGQPDVLKADLKLATPESGNLLQNTNGVLYASNKALDIKLSDHVGTNVEAAIINLNDRITSSETTVGDFTEKVTNLESTVNSHTTLIDANKQDIDNLKIDNNQNKQDIVDVKGNITEIEGRLDGLDSSVNDINTNIDTIEKNIEDLQAKTDIVAEDTNSVDMTFTHSSNSSTIKADVKVSQEEGNLLSIKNDGLFAIEDYDFGTY